MGTRPSPMTWPDVDRPLLASHPVDPYDGPILFKKSPCADECHAGIGAGSGSPSGASEHAHDDIHDGNDCTDHHPPTSCMEPSDDGQGEEDSLDEGLGLRWVVLALNCLLLLGNYFAYDNPAALRTLIDEYLDMAPADFDYLFGLFYAVYSLPNIILPLMAGYVMDRVGPRRVLLFLSACVCAGQRMGEIVITRATSVLTVVTVIHCIVAFIAGMTNRSPALMLAGRAVFGIGGESISVAQACITTSWFRNKELAFALGLNLAVPRVGSVLNAMLSPAIAVNWNESHPISQDGVLVALWVGFGMCMVSVASAILLVFFTGCEPPSDETTPKRIAEDTCQHNALSEETQPLIVSVVDPIDGRVLIPAVDTTSFTDAVRQLPFIFWLLCVEVMLIYGIIVPFNIVANEYLQAKWFAGDPERAGQVMSIPDSVCAVLVPIFGIVVDRVGRRATLLGLSCLVIGGVHLTLAFVPQYAAPLSFVPIGVLIILGAAYSVFGAVYWSAIAYVFEPPASISETSNQESSQTIATASPSPAIGSPGTRRLADLARPRYPESFANSPAISRRSRHASSTSSSTRRASIAQQQRLVDEYHRRRLPSATLPMFAAALSIGSIDVHGKAGGDRALPDSTRDSESSSSKASSHLAIAYGLSTSAMNLSLTLVPMLVAALRQHSEGPGEVGAADDFIPVELCFAIEAFLGAAVAVLVYVENRRSGGALESAGSAV